MKESNKSAIAIRNFADTLIFQTTGELVLSRKVVIPTGYVNLTQMLQAASKETGKKKGWNNYFANKTTQEFLQVVSDELELPIINNKSVTGIPVTTLIVVIQAGKSDEQGTWGHPDIAIHLAQWCSPKFAYWASKTLRLVINGEFQALTPEAQQAQDKLNEIYSRLRAATIETFWFITEEIKEYYEQHPRQEKYPGQNYSEVMDKINLGLFGKQSKTIKAELGINKGQLNRNHFGEESLKRIEMVQRIGKSQIGKGVHPMDAVTMAIDIMSYDCIDYNN